MDRCTLWLDGWPTWLGGTGDEWRGCCAAHDRFYEQAHTFGGYLSAHWDLARCVAEVSTGMAGVMLTGLVAATVAFGAKVLPAWYWSRR